MSPEPADAVWAGLVAGALAADVLLDKHDRALLTHRVRTPGGWFGVGILVSHFGGWLPRYLDPFSVVSPIADWLNR